MNSISRHHIYISNKRYAFKEIFKEFYTSQLFFASKLLSNRHDAEDVVQDVFLNIWRAKPVFKNELAFKSYLYLSTRNKCIDFLRKKRPMYESVELAQEIPHEIDYLIKEEAFRILDKAIGTLSPQTQEVLNLSLKGLSVQEVAQALNVSVNTIKTVKLRAYKVLRENYGHSLILIMLSYISF